MKVLTVKQPWADLIINSSKDIENRTWKTKYRGRILIHAAKSDDKEAMKYWGSPGQAMVDPNNITRGAIIGSIEIVDCVEHSMSSWFQGPWGWVLKDPQVLTPIFCKGQLSLWEYKL